MGSGDRLAISFKDELNYKNRIKGNFAQFSGKGQLIKFYEDTVQVMLMGQVDRMPSKQFMELETPVKVLDALKPSLVTEHTRALTADIFESATVEAYPNFANSGPTIDRVIYGGKPYPNDGFIRTGIDSLTGGAAYNQDGTSVAAIRKLRDYAVLGGATYEAEKRISPTRLEKRMGGWVPTYYYLMDTVSYRSLCLDPSWAQYFGRGVIESAYQPSGLVGGFIKGMIDNIIVMEVPELALYQQTSTDGNHKIAWNMLVGAQAWYLLWGKAPWFWPELTNMGLDFQLGMLEIRGQKALKIPSKKNPQISVENGIIHHFVEITGL